MISPTIRSTPVPSLFANRYLLADQIGRGGMGAVYRAKDRLQKRLVALKQVSWSSLNWRPRYVSSRPADGLEVALAHEFRTLASLRHPNIISVLDYGFDSERQPYFTMDLLENAVTIREAGHGQPLAVQVDLLIQLLRALDYLHRRQIIHCDLKPSNVLVVGGQVKVLDFGLSTQIGGNNDTSGSLLYMAPETLADGTINVTSDLYAVGVIAYEMVVGRTPFMEADLDALIDAIQFREPDLSEVDPYTEVLSVLLAKDPSKRYGNARDVMNAVGHLVAVPPVIETSAVRESFLQAAQFVGRDAELEALQQVLKQAVAGQGSSWLISGESGIGKSRLLDELQIRALVEGVLVMRGQSISDGGSPYQMWRPIVRWLCLLTDLTEVEAVVFKTLVPDIESLLNRRVNNLPETDFQVIQQRLINATESVLRRQPYPIVMLLEDLHWAGDESLAMLTYFSNIVSQLPILILATYRDDERPSLPAMLGAMKHLALKRLDQDAVAEFATGILGKAAVHAPLSKLLFRETEGNTFFLVEVMRALTEEAGHLDAISSIDLPDHIFTGGIQNFVRRRLHRVPPEFQNLLKLAAIAGRQLDLQMLPQLDPAINLQTWLDHCSNVAVLELRDNVWRFAHDKLRDGLLQEIDPGEQRIMHHTVALAFESFYADAPEHAAVLAYHWGEADVKPKQIHFLFRAGEEARRSGANQTAGELLDKAARLAEFNPVAISELVQMERLLGDTCIALGKLGESIIHMQEALKLLGHQPPDNEHLVLACLKQLLIQIVHRFGLYRYRPLSTVRADEMQRIAEVYEHLTLYYYFMGHTLHAIHGTLSTVNFAERTRQISPVLSHGYGGVAVAAGMVMLHSVAEFYFRRSETVAKTVNQPRVWIMLHQRRDIYYLARARWGETQRHILEAKAMAQSIHDERSWRETALTEAFQVHFQGKLEESLTLVAEIRASAERDKDVQTLLYCASFGSAGLLRLGRFDEAITLLTQYKDHDSNVVPLAERGRIVNFWGQLSLAYFYSGRYQESREAIEILVNHLTVNTTPDSGFPFVFGYAASLEASLRLREMSAGSKDEALRVMSEVILKVFRAFARRFEVGRPGFHRLKGSAEWLDGKQAAAQKSWVTGLSWARKLSIPLEEAFILAEIARHSNNEALRNAYLSQAYSIFDRLGASHYKEPFALVAAQGDGGRDEATHAGVRIYSDFTLKLYDLIVLGLSNALVWQVPTRRILDFYDKHVSANHLDVGVGTGYFLDKCQFPSPSPSVTLIDLNPTSLKVTAQRLRRYRPATHVVNVLEPFRFGSAMYDSIGLGYLLHCLPGTMRDKEVVFRNLKPLLHPGGVLFGTTLLGKDVKRNKLAQWLMDLYNRTGTFSNQQDSLEELEQILKRNFESYTVQVVGCAVFFTATSC